ncbi:type II secretion system F family protein, partial [bacterium]
TFHEAMAKHPKVFSELWINLVESGEASGNLAVVLERLANYLERLEEFKKKIISSLIYPALLFTAGMGALLFMTMKIIPTFAQLFEGFNIKLPLLTQMLLVFSNFIRKYALVMIAGAWIGIYLFRQYIKTNEGRRRFEKFCFDMPVMGDFFKAMIVERYSSEMSTLLESGVPILYSLEITEHSVGNLIVADIIRKVKESVRDGKPLSQPMEKSGFFEPMVVQMVAIGEEIGELPNMFRRINTFYQGVVETFLIRFTALFEPLMLVFMGAVIGLMVVGIFLPIFQIANVGGSG